MNRVAIFTIDAGTEPFVHEGREIYASKEAQRMLKKQTSNVSATKDKLPTSDHYAVMPPHAQRARRAGDAVNAAVNAMNDAAKALWGRGR